MVTLKIGALLIPDNAIMAFWVATYEDGVAVASQGHLKIIAMAYEIIGSILLYAYQHVSVVGQRTQEAIPCLAVVYRIIICYSMYVNHACLVLPLSNYTVSRWWLSCLSFSLRLSTLSSSSNFFRLRS